MGACAEISSFDTGVHVWLKDATEPDWWVGTEHIEVYDSVQYITVTGERFSEAPTSVSTPPNFEQWLQDHGETTDAHSLKQERKDTSGQERDGIELGVCDVLSRSSYPEGERVGHPYHGSSTETNFKIFEGGETWHCFRHDVTGNALHLIGIEEGVINCGDWKNRDLTDKEWIKTFDADREAGYDLPEPSDSDGWFPSLTALQRPSSNSKSVGFRRMRKSSPSGTLVNKMPPRSRRYLRSNHWILRRS